MSLSNYAELELLDHLLGTGSFTMPSNVYIKLHIGDPGEDGSSNAATETTRKAITFDAAASGSADSAADVDWTSVAGSEQYTYFSLWDASTAGNCLLIGSLTASAVTAGDNFTIPAGDLTVTAD